MDSGEKKTVPSEVDTKPAETPARPYEPPRLRHLGSVRALTLGASGRPNDTGNGQRQPAGRRSSRDVKEQIQYLDSEQRQRLAGEVLGLKLATYFYKPGVEDDDRHVGFIIEDAPAATFVKHDEKMVDLYGFASALAACVQEQQATIRRLESELTALKSKL
jgi:hypothetical protein